MLVMVTHGGGLKLWNHICQLENCCSCHLDFGWLEAQEKTFPKHWFSFMFDATVSIFLALILGRALLFHFCMHEGRSQHSVADMRVHCSILVTQIPWKICPDNDNANMQRPFVLQTYLFFAEGRPDGVRKYRKMRPKVRKYHEISVQFGSVRTKRTFFWKRTFFSPSVRPSVKTVSAVGTTRSGPVDVLNPRVYFSEVSQCANVCPRSWFYISTQIVDPKLFCQEVSVIRSDIEQKGALLVKHFVELGELVTKRTVTCFVARVDFPLFFSPERCFPCLKGWCPLPW